MRLYDLPRFGRARIETLPDGLYRPSDEGGWAVVLGACDQFGEIVDAVAWHPEDPGHWWLRHGNETAVLGAPALAFAADEAKPIRLLSTPDGWLMEHMRYLSEGNHSDYPIACVIDWGAALEPLFHGIPRVDCDGPELHKRLLRSFREWEPRTFTTNRSISRAA